MNRIADFEAIGTHWNIDIDKKFDEGHLVEVMQRVMECIKDFDRTYSRFRPDSLVTQMSLRPGAYFLPDNAEPMMALYRRLYDMTDGAFTPLIGQLLSDIGYDAVYSLVSLEPIAPPAWDDVMEFRDSTLIVREPVLLDFGAGGKGYLVDLVAEILLVDGIDSFVVNAGGDIRVVGRAQKVGLEHPSNVEQAIGIATFQNQSICGSAGNRRKWGKFEHTIDPRVLESPKHILAVWVVAATTMLADALTTCLYFVTPEVLLAEFTFEYAIVSVDLSITVSANFPAEFFS